MTPIGETLRRERMRRNLSLEPISKELKIAPKLLEAIEADDFQKLPGGVFTKSFVRQYARYLGLDEEEIAGELHRLFEPPPMPASGAAPELRRPEPPIALPRVERWETVGDRHLEFGSWLPALAMVVVVMLICSGIYAWWQRARRPATVARGTPPAVAVQTPPAAPKEEGPAVSPAAPPASTPVPASPDASRQAPEIAAAPASSPTQTAPAQQAPGVPPPAAAASNVPVHVILTAGEPVWVSARSDGKFNFSGTLDANQTRSVDANTSITLRLGNAGGINISLNGKTIGPVGPKGQVRTVQLTSGGFQIVEPEASKPPAPPLKEELVDPF